MILIRFRRSFEGRVLELGCGTGRLLGYLLAFGGEVHAIDISPRMVHRAGDAYPDAQVRLGDLRDLSQSAPGRFDVILASDNVIDVLDDAGRRRLLAELAGRYLSPGGLFVFCSHNLEAGSGPSEADGGSAPAWRRRVAALADHSPAGVIRWMRIAPRRWINRRRLRSGEYRGSDYAILNDVAHDFGLLHYYIGRDAQECQLHVAGMDLVTCLNQEGSDVPRGQPGSGTSLYYVATPVSSAPGDPSGRDAPCQNS